MMQPEVEEAEGANVVARDGRPRLTLSFRLKPEQQAATKTSMTGRGNEMFTVTGEEGGGRWGWGWGIGGGRGAEKTLEGSCFGPTLLADERHDFLQAVGLQRNLTQVESGWRFGGTRGRRVASVWRRRRRSAFELFHVGRQAERFPPSHRSITATVCWEGLAVGRRRRGGLR